jgi:hypothetical protein
MLFLTIAVVVCSLVCWLVVRLGVEAIQALLALAMMILTWRLLGRRPHMTIADEFRHW